MNQLPQTWPETMPTPAKRDAWQAMMRGFRNRCPNCGEGRMFRAYLKSADRCTTCGEDLSHHRADDFPAYIVILIVGHLLVPIILAVETNFAPPLTLQMVIWPAILVAMSLSLLQPVKGCVIGLQWAFRMHGFEGKTPDSEIG